MKLTIVQQLEAANQELEKLRAENSALTSKVASIEESTVLAASEAASKVAALTTINESLNQKLSSAEEKILSLEQAQQSANQKALDIAAQVGVPAVAAEVKSSEPQTAEEIKAAFAQMKAGPERTAFFKQHRKILN